LEDCTVENLAPALEALLLDDAAVDKQKAGYDEAMKKLRGSGEAPGIQAAKIIRELVSAKV